MNSYKDKLWERISEIASPHGLEVFDIEPSSAFLRVFITRQGSVTAYISDCTKLSREILDLPDVEELLPGDCQLEVSSPGVNRKLSRDEHFTRAIGERLRVVVGGDETGKGKEVLRGKLLSFDGKKLEIDEESKKSVQVIDYKNVSEARVDFNFNI